MEYTQLDPSARLNHVRGRIREIEQQYFTLQLRVEAPDLSVPPSTQDQTNLAQLEQSLTVLHQMEKDLSSPPAPAPAPQDQAAESPAQA